MTNSNQTFSCESCNTTFNSRDELKDHSINEHEHKSNNTNSELTFSCESCNQSFHSQEELRKHSINEHEGK